MSQWLTSNRRIVAALAGLMLLGFGAPVWAQDPSCPSGACGAIATCSTCVNTCHCPPAYKYIQEGPPKLCFKQGCGKPVCDPCRLEHFGYYQSCWQPWPYPPDWRHCHVPPPSVVLATPAMMMAPPLPGRVAPGIPPQKMPEPTSPLPTPRKLENGQPVKPL